VSRTVVASLASLILLDDWGRAALSAQDRADLQEIVGDRVNTASSIRVITSS
jgi:DNA replication protein DnaC